MSLLKFVIDLFGTIKSTLNRLARTPVVWAATLNGQSVQLVSIAMALDTPQSRYRVIYVDTDGISHTVRALHDFDGKPADMLMLDDIRLPNGDMDIIFNVLKYELRLNFEWEGNRLQLTTDMRENEIGQKIIALVD